MERKEVTKWQLELDEEKKVIVVAYDRVNWQNQPSTATPINADNLNKMDKGINDLEEGKIPKSDIVQTDTINDPNKVPSSAVTHVLGQEIATLNNNFTNKTTYTFSLSAGYEQTNLILYKQNGFLHFEGEIRCDVVADAMTLFGSISAGAANQMTTYKPWNITALLYNPGGTPVSYVHLFILNTGSMRLLSPVGLTGGILRFNSSYHID